MDTALELKVLGGTYQRNKDYLKACECYEKLVKLDEKSMNYLELRNIAYCYKMIGDKKMEKLYHDKADAVSTPAYIAKKAVPRNIEKRRNNQTVPQKIAKVGIKKEKGFLYFVDKEGDVSAAESTYSHKSSGVPQKVAKVGIKKEVGYLYFVDEDGDISANKLTK